MFFFFFFQRNTEGGTLDFVNGCLKHYVVSDCLILSLLSGIISYMNFFFPRSGPCGGSCNADLVM